MIIGRAARTAQALRHSRDQAVVRLARDVPELCDRLRPKPPWA